MTEALVRFGPTAEQRGTRLSATTPDAAAPLWVNREALEGALSKLLEHALRFVPRGSDIFVRLEAAPDRLRVDVWDQGHAVSQGEGDAIFERLPQGAGLDGAADGDSVRGMAQARDLVELDGGTLTLVHRGVGPRFRIELPRGAVSPVRAEVDPEIDGEEPAQRIRALVPPTGDGEVRWQAIEPDASYAFVLRLRDAAEPRLSELGFSTSRLARALALSPRTLQVRMQLHGLPPPNEWLRAMRIEVARALLRSGRIHGVAEAATAVGMSRSYFTRTYTAALGHPPADDLAR